jgi:hypothetical protein
MELGRDIDALFSFGRCAEFFAACESYCTPGCCSIGAYGPPSLVALDAVAPLSGEERCALARRMRHVVARLRADRAAPRSACFNATWPSGVAAADWLEEWLVWIEFSLGLRDRPAGAPE